MDWKKIKAFNTYSVNKNGEVRNDKTGHIKKHFINKNNGYPTVTLYANGEEKNVTIHRLVAEAFIPNPENKPTVDHKDGNRQNNSVENLRWATYSEQNSRFNTVGVRSQKVKVTHFPEVRKMRGGGHVKWLEPDAVMIFKSVTETAQYFGITLGNITQLAKNNSIGKRGVTRGYRFEYV